MLPGKPDILPGKAIFQLFRCFLGPVPCHPRILPQCFTKVLEGPREGLRLLGGRGGVAPVDLAGPEEWDAPPGQRVGGAQWIATRLPTGTMPPAPGAGSALVKKG